MSRNSVPKGVVETYPSRPRVLAPLQSERDSTLLSVHQVARRLGTSRSHVYRLVASRKLAHVKTGALVRVLPQDVEAYLRAHRVESCTNHYDI